MEISKELKTGIIAVIAIGLLIAGVNFLKGNSFFGGDDVYYVYLPDTGGVSPSTSVYVNGVVVGKVLDIKVTDKKAPNKKVLMTISIQESYFKIPVGSSIYSGSIDLLTKGLIIEPNDDISKFQQPGDYIQGKMPTSLFSEVKEHADPLLKKIENVATSLDKFIVSFQAFWDTTANTEIKQTFDDLQVALKKFGNIATELDGLVTSEKAKLSTIFTNVESITSNLQKSNAKIESILTNVDAFSEDLVSADFKGTIDEAKNVLNKFNTILDSASKGEGTLGKLLKDDQLYNELNNTNKRLQNLIEDVEVHPERYIHFSVFGAKTKGVPLSPSEERKLKQMLDSTKTK